MVPSHPPSWESHVTKISLFSMPFTDDMYITWTAYIRMMPRPSVPFTLIPLVFHERNQGLYGCLTLSSKERSSVPFGPGPLDSWIFWYLRLILDCFRVQSKLQREGGTYMLEYSITYSLTITLASLASYTVTSGIFTSDIPTFGTLPVNNHGTHSIYTPSYYLTVLYANIQGIQVEYRIRWDEMRPTGILLWTLLILYYETKCTELHWTMVIYRHSLRPYRTIPGDTYTYSLLVFYYEPY